MTRWDFAGFTASVRSTAPEQLEPPLSEIPPQVDLDGGAANGDQPVDAMSASRVRSGLWPLVAVAALGVLAVAVAFAEARKDTAWAPALFWAGLIVIVGPIGFRLFGRDVSYAERLGICLTLGLALYAVKYMYSPQGFTLHDELGQLRSTEDLFGSGALYAHNPIVGTYGYFPGLHATTAAFASISGLSLFTSGVIVLAIARAVLMVAIFAFLERVTQSGRIAGIGALLYAANPNFLYFDSQYSYESLAVPLAMAALLAASWADRQDPGRARVSAVVFALLLAAAVVVTHHMTSYALLVALVIWAAAAVFRHEEGERRSVVPIIAIGTAALAGGWLFVAGNAVWNELWPVLSDAATGVWDILIGSAGAKAPFTAAKGHVDPVYIKVLGLASVACLLLALPWALIATWRERDRHPAMWLLGLAALAYPITLALRLTMAGTETSNRASEFVFLGVSAAIGLAYMRWLSERIDSGSRRLALRLAATGLACIVVLGGMTVGTSSTALLPGPYKVGADSRSITAESIAAARWARNHLPENSRVLTDSSNKGLIASYGLQDPQGGEILGRPVGAIFEAQRLAPGALRMIAADKLEYLVVDLRLSRELPRSGHYFDSGDTKNHDTALTLSALKKFKDSHLIDRVYTSGNVSIYSAKPLLRERR